jgi:hypothetical protein
MSHADKANLVLPFAQGLDQRIDAVAHKAEDHRHTPANQCINDDVAGVLCRTA